MWQLGKPQEALDAFEQALSLQPDYPLAWYSRGVTLLQLGKYQDALEAFDQSIASSPDAPKTWLGRGAALAILVRYQEALESCDQALRLTPDDPDAWLSKGMALWELRRSKEAHRAFESAFSLRTSLPDGGSTLYNTWAISALAQGLDALLSRDIGTFEEAGLKYIGVLEKAQQDGMGQTVENALAQFKGRLKNKKEREAFEELGVFINLMKIKDPFEGWRALGKEISKVWPQGLSAVKAVREIRR